ncbi:calcium-channel protein Cch1p [[Candida] jaroonii]|uniref:Calcium-channel protein Cch1p n=1 Tax=[Candida] jaroonii TaxID=467808 RepID=A0ACA9Y0S8_9ASCO|nr:calcium-channel protein Cch1p [[Candida] jaroonii]
MSDTFIDHTNDDDDDFHRAGSSSNNANRRLSGTSRRKSTKRPFSFKRSSILSIHSAAKHEDSITEPEVENTTQPNVENNDTFVTKSLLDDAAGEQDFNAIKESLKIALGTESGDSNWFPMHNNNDLKVHQPRKKPPPMNIPTLHIDTSNQTHSPVIRTPRPTHLNPFDMFNDSSSNLQPASPSLRNNKDIESGLLTPTFALNDEAIHGSPGKFTNLITRVSDRIAGTGTSAELTSRKSPSLRDDHSVKSTFSSQNHSSTSVNLNPSLNTQDSRDGSSLAHSVEEFQDDHRDVFDLETESFQYSNQDHSISRNLSHDPFRNTNEDLNDAIGLQDTEPPGLGLHHSRFPTTNSVAFENVPFTNKVLPQTKISQIWQSDKSSMYLFGNTLKFFSPQNKFRLSCHHWVSNKLNNTFFLSLLILQTSLLSLRQWNPAHLHGYVEHGNNWADYILCIINVVYTLEMAAKIIAYGFYDDRIMFEELNLPYPENPVKGKLLKGTWFEAIKEHFAILLTKTTKFNQDSSRPSYNKTDLNEVYTEEIELEDQTPESERNEDRSKHEADYSNVISSKYDLSSHHQPSENLNTTFTAPPVGRLKPANTLLKNDRPVIDIESLHLRRAYIRNSWHRIDFVSIVCFWISLLVSIRRYDAKHNLLIFRALSCLRILRLCNLTRGTSLILKALKNSIPELVDVIIFIGCFGLFFGIVGVQSFKSSLRRHCVWYNPDDSSDTFVNTDSFCGSYLDVNGHARPYILSNGEHSSSIKGFRCPVYSRCETLDNPSEGTVHFDNIFNSLEQVFVIMSANTFTDILYMTLDTDTLAAALYFVFGMLIMTVWLLNVFIAIVVSTFNMTRSDDNKDDQEDGLLGATTTPVSMHKELIEKLKKQNIALGIYYRLEFIFPIVVVCDLVAQCFRSYGMSPVLAHTLYRLEASFTGIFFIEIILRFFLYLPNWRLFFKLKRNNFDLFLAVITTIIIIGPIKNKLGHAYYWLTIFQIMRGYRVVLLFSFTSELWLKIMGNIGQLLDLSLFYFLLTMLTSIIYSRFFEGVITAEMADEDDDITFDFQSLPNTFAGLYTITSTENWTDILYALQGYQTSASARVFAAIFLIGWFLISNMVILNIFIAVIASTLNVPEAEKKRKQLLQFIENITVSIQHVDNESGALSKYKNRFFKRKGMAEELQMAVVNLLLSGTAVNNFLDDHDVNDVDDEEVQELHHNKFVRFFVVHFKRFRNYFDDPFKITKPKVAQISSFDPTTYAKNILNERNVLITKQNQYLRDNPTYNKVFYVMGPRHKIRRFCQRIVNSSYGERIDGVEPYKRVSEIFTVVMLISTVALVVTACYLTPLYRSSIATSRESEDWTFWLEILWLCIFSGEFTIRIFADGLIYTPNAYARSSWNLIDFVVLCSLWIQFTAYVTSNGDLSRFVRGFKALRALRILTISETAKNNFHNTIISGIGKIFSAAILSLCLLIPFSIWGLNIFNGRLGVCTDGTSDLASCLNEYNPEVFDWEVMSPNVYANPLLHFDYFAKSFSTLFEITSLEGWVDLLLNLMQSTGIGTVPVPFATPINGFFMILYNFIGIVFILTLFISVIIHNYSLSSGRAYMTTDQRSWYHVKNFLLQVRPSKRENADQLGPIRRFCYRMTVEKHKGWNALLNVVLFAHVIALLLEKYPSSVGLNAFTTTIYLMASGLFTLNAIMLLISQGLKNFIRYRWNVFNMVVSVGALITTIIGFAVSEESAFTNINKLFLVGTLLFVIPRSDRLSQFLRFASASVPNLISLLFTWLVLFLVFAIAMNQVFGTTKIGANGSGNLNVRTVPKALILLFKCSFGEGWNYVMDDFKIAEPYCSTKPNSTETDCGNKQYAFILFYAWNIVSMYIFLNMFISLILDGFSYITNKGDYSRLVERREIRKFKRTWQEFDPEGTGFIPPKELPKLLRSLDGELSFHFYHGSLEIPLLCHKWIKRLSNDPYDIQVNYDEIEKSYEEWDIDKIRERRKSYETFIEEAILNMELNREPGISFRRVLLQLPLYKTFNAGTCLNLIDYLERTLLLQKVEKRMHQNRVYETITAYVIRWKYLQDKKLGVKSANLNLDKALKRRSYLSGERSPMEQPYLDDQFEKNFGTQEDFSLYKDNFEDTVPVGASSGLFSDSDDDQHLTKSGVYVPRSPLEVKKKNDRPLSRPPKFFISVPQGTNEEESTKSTDSLVEISEIGETLKDSPWGDTLKDINHRDKNH